MATLLQYRSVGRITRAHLQAAHTSNILITNYQEETVDGRIITVIGWDGPNDPENPKNWSTTQKWKSTILVSLLALLVGVCAPIDSPILTLSANEFGVTPVVESLSVALFLVGLGFGALISGPLSEVLGRSRTYLVTLVSLCIWLLGSALAPNAPCRYLFRLLAGLSGATPLVCSGGTISDIWSPLERTLAFPFFAIVGFGTPALGPVMSSWIPAASTTASWRWAPWMALIFGGIVLLVLVVFQPETYAPTILSWKAAQIRKATGKDHYHSRSEIYHISFTRRLQQACVRPFSLAWHEVSIQLASLYLAIIYTILFTFFDGYPMIFGEVYGVSSTITYVILAGITVGAITTGLLIPIAYCRCALAVQSSPYGHVDPFVRLWFAILAAPGLPLSLFWMAWTSRSSISIWSPILASVLFGFSTTAIFISISMYLIDAYSEFAASAMAFTYLARYLAAGIMTVAGIPLYENLGYRWTLTLLGCLSVMLTPLPYYLHYVGTRN